MRKFIIGYRFRFFLIALFSISRLYGVELRANDEIKIALLTCSPGDELYSTFGHSALRVYDMERGIDVVYNFGLFDFNTPYFYHKFLMGRLDYMLGTHSTSGFIRSYSNDDRRIYQQILDLSREEKETLLMRLDWLSQPQNRYYRYSFLSKNCTTELRDLLFSYLNVNRDFFRKRSLITRRELLNGYMGNKLWIRLGVNMILGSELDREVDLRESMFVPNELMRYTDSIRLDNGRALVSDKSVILDQSGEEPDSIDLFQPIVCFIILASLYVALLLFRRRSMAPVLALFFIVGLIGLFIGGLILFTDHTELHWNYNLLWCNPLYFVLATLICIRRYPKMARALCIGLFGCSLSVVAVWLSGIQYMEPSFLIALFMLLCGKTKFLYERFRLRISTPEIAK